MERSNLVSFRVINPRPAIAPAFLPLRFDPDRRERKPEGRSTRLGLGLYIAERIVHGRGGMLEAPVSGAQGRRHAATFSWLR